MPSYGKIQQISPDFAYAGNDVVDFVLFAHAKHSYLVNPSRKVRLALNRQSVDACNFSQTFDITSSPSAHKLWLQQLRIHQWLKNLLLFVPLLVSGLFTDVSKMPLLFIAFLLHLAQWLQRLISSTIWSIYSQIGVIG
ncbi:MAG: hypothetical protein U5L01_15375 [Rheinheimera sp.]|nr:hypothetical protein [Rheinheimera sp.]